MLGGLAQAGAKALAGSRFSLANLVPVTLLIVFILVLAGSGLYCGGAPHFSQVILLVSENAGLAVLATFGIFLLAVLLRPYQAALVQLLEGYWDHVPGLPLLAEQAVERHRRILRTAMTTRGFAPMPRRPTSRRLMEVARGQRTEAKLGKLKNRAERVIARYPLPSEENEDSIYHGDRLLPTLLGNALRDAEDNAGRRYGLALPTIAPRLYPHISDKLAAPIRQNLDLIDTTAAICISFALAGLASLPLIARWDLWSLVPVVAFLLSLASYRGAVQSARTHAVLLAAAVDLHRFDMIRALHYPLPRTTAEERIFNRYLTIFLRNRNAAVEHGGIRRYEHPATSQAQPPPPDAAGSSAADSGSSE